MSKNTYPLKLPTSVKKAAAELAATDGVSLNQFIAAAVAEKVDSLRAADDLLRERAGTAKPKDMLKYLRLATVIPERFEAEGFFEGETVRFVRLKSDVRFANPGAGVGNCEGRVFCGNLLHADTDLQRGLRANRDIRWSKVTPVPERSFGWQESESPASGSRPCVVTFPSSV